MVLGGAAFATFIRCSFVDGFSPVESEQTGATQTPRAPKGHRLRIGNTNPSAVPHICYPSTITLHSPQQPSTEAASRPSARSSLS